MSIRGVIFDLNGTLVADIGYLGVTLDDATLQSFNGLKNEDIVPRLLGRPFTADEFERLTSFKEERYRGLYRPHLAPIRGAEELLARLRAGGVRIAIASSAPPANRDMILDGLGWRARMDAVVAAENLPGKPAPDVFLEAARQFHVAPAECLVFEDAVHGVTAGVAAGMIVVGVTTTVPGATLVAAGARYAAPDLASLPEGVLAMLPG
jgi:beta-phosphoglucomutase